jgi:hypothetical protein
MLPAGTPVIRPRMCVLRLGRRCPIPEIKQASTECARCIEAPIDVDGRVPAED